MNNSEDNQPKVANYSTQESGTKDLVQQPLFGLEAKRVISRDEMNLSEFPLTVLSTRANSSIKTLEFSDKIRTKTGDTINRSWIITGADKFGLPTSSDDEVLLGLLKLTVDQQFTSRKIVFSRYELLKNLRWSTEGRNYSRLQKALDRLSGVRIKATNAFFDNEAKSHSTKNFGIIDGYELNDGRDNNRPSFFLWSEVIFKSFQSGFIKKLDLDFYLDLQSAVSKRIYRYLDKHFWYKSKVQVNFFIFAHEKIGVSRTYQYVSSIRQQIDPALEELKSRGFIKDYSYSGQGSATEIIILAASAQPRVLAAQSPNTTATSTELKNSSQHDFIAPVLGTTASMLVDDSLTAETCRDISQHHLTSVSTKLIDRGINPQQAQRLLADISLNNVEKIERIISYYDFLLSSGSKLVSRNPIGFLFKAVQTPDKFVLPEENAAQAKVKAAASDNTKAGQSKENYKYKQQADLKAKYLAFRKQELIKLSEDCEPDLYHKLKKEVEYALIKVKSLISENNFREAVDHGVQEKLAKLFAVPEFEEWSKSRI
jgi:hypothetical protein